MATVEIAARQSQVVRTARGIVAILQPLTGDRASGTSTMACASAGDSVRLPRGYYFLPVVGGVVRADLALKAGPGSEADESWLVASGGTAVDLVSNLGGARHNLAAGTVLRPDPPVPELTAGMTVAAPGMTGGVDATGFGALKDLQIYEQLNGPALNVDAKRSGLKRFPGAVLMWADMQQATGVTSPQTQRAARTGTRRVLYRSTYALTFMSTSYAADSERRHEGLACVEAAMKLLTDRQMVDGEAISSPGGVEIYRAYREPLRPDVAAKWYVYTFELGAELTLCQTDARTYSNLLRMVMDVHAQQHPELPDQGDLPLVQGATLNMEE